MDLADLEASPWGQLLEEARNALGLTRKQVAKRAGLTDNCVADNERGWRKIDNRWVQAQGRPLTIARIAFAVDVKPDQLSALKITPRWSKPLHMAAALALEEMHGERDKPPDPQVIFERVLRTIRDDCDTVGEFLERMLTLSGDLAPARRRNSRPKGQSRDE